MVVWLLRLLFRLVSGVVGASTATSLWLWWRVKRAQRVGNDNLAESRGCALALTVLLDGLSMLAAGGVGLGLTAASSDPAERDTVRAISLAMLVPPLAGLGWFAGHWAKDAELARNMYRWVSIDEAVVILNGDTLGRFRCGGYDPMATETLRGRRTGIKVLDWGEGDYKDMWVEPALRPILEPVARAARERTGRPLWIVIDDVSDPPVLRPGDSA